MIEAEKSLCLIISRICQQKLQQAGEMLQKQQAGNMLVCRKLFQDAKQVIHVKIRTAMLKCSHINIVEIIQDQIAEAVPVLLVRNAGKQFGGDRANRF